MLHDGAREFLGGLNHPRLQVLQFTSGKKLNCSL